MFLAQLQDVRFNWVINVKANWFLVLPSLLLVRARRSQKKKEMTLVTPIRSRLMILGQQAFRVNNWFIKVVYRGLVLPGLHILYQQSWVLLLGSRARQISSTPKYM